MSEHYSNFLVVLCIAGLLGYMLYQVPDAEWTSNVMSAGLGGLVGFLNGNAGAKQ